MKQHVDRCANAVPSSLAVGDCVLVQQQRKNKLTPNYNPEPYMIIETKGLTVTAEIKGHRITRNSSHFKHFPTSTKYETARNMDSDIDTHDDTPPRQVQQEPGPLAAAPRGLPPAGNPARRYPARNRRPPRFYYTPNAVVELLPHRHCVGATLIAP